MEAIHYSACCQGETCKCGKPATHKVEEVIFHDDPNPIRHPLTAYVCGDCFKGIMMWDADPLFGTAALQRQLEQSGINTRWLIDNMDRIRAALCPDAMGTWQQRVEQTVAAAESLGKALKV